MKKLQKTSFILKRKLFAIPYSYLIFEPNTQQKLLFKAKRKLFNKAFTIIIQDLSENMLTKVLTSSFFAEKWNVLSPNNQILAKVFFSKFNFFKMQFKLKIGDQLYSSIPTSRYEFAFVKV